MAAVSKGNCARRGEAGLQRKKGHFIIIIITTTTTTTTAIGLSPGGSSPTLVQTKIKIYKTT
jgi:hypothetical protein